MKVARLYSFTDIRIEEMPPPEPGPGEALVRTRASGICSGDVMPWYIERKAPLVLGHEPSGVIERVGPDVVGFAPGDRVFVHHHAPCMECGFCKRGDHVQCPTWRRTRLHPGGMAEFFLVPRECLAHDTLILPPQLGFDDAVLVEPLGCVLKGLRRAGYSGGQARVLVIGLGVMGMLHVMAARHMGAKEIVGADMVPYRLDKALDLGARSVHDASRGPVSGAYGRWADLVVVGPNNVMALEEGLRCAAPGGRVIMFTPVRPGETLTIAPNDLYFRDISLVTSYSCGPVDTREALGMIESGGVRATALVTHRFPIEGVAEAYRLTARAGESLKCIVEFPPGT